MYDLIQPVSIDFDYQSAKDFGLFGGYIDIFTSTENFDINRYQIAIIGVEEERNAVSNEGTRFAPNEIRKKLYELYPGKWNMNIIDLGNLITGKDVEETYENLGKLVHYIEKKAINLIVLGGSQDLTFGITKKFDQHNKIYNLSVIDSIIDSSLLDDEIDNENYLTKIISHKFSHLNNLSIFGLQTYYNHPEKFNILNKLMIDYYKLGQIQNQIHETEPELREADIVSIDINAIKNSEMPGQAISRPNGLNGQEICTISRLAGIATKNKTLGIFEYNPYFDKNHLGANLIAQIIWYYIEGKNAYVEDYPDIPKEELIKFYVNNEIVKLNFYQNPKTRRWWVELPGIESNGKLYACSKKDYKNAVNLNISERIYNIINKTSI